MIFGIAFFHFLIVLIPAIKTGKKDTLITATIISSVIAIFHGAFTFFIFDIIGIALGYFIGLKVVNPTHQENRDDPPRKNNTNNIKTTTKGNIVTPLPSSDNNSSTWVVVILIIGVIYYNKNSDTPAKTAHTPKYISNTLQTEQLPRYTSRTTDTEQIPRYTSRTTDTEQLPRYTSRTTETEQLPRYEPIKEVKEAQELLNKLGYNAGKADGIKGKKTLAAMHRFQDFSSIKRSNIIDNKLLSILNKVVTDSSLLKKRKFSTPPIKAPIITVPKIQMVNILSGCFYMGGDDNEPYNEIEVDVGDWMTRNETIKVKNKYLRHEVCITSDFKIGIFEVTQEQWFKVMGYNPSFFKGGNRPVENVSWFEVKQFINKLNEVTKLNYRLPSEAEWEYVCKSGKHNIEFHEDYCGKGDLKNLGWYKGNSQETQPVGELKPNKLGLYDMSGNVGEWVLDWYDEFYYLSSPTNDPLAEKDSTKNSVVHRGCSWAEMSYECNFHYRFKNDPKYKSNKIGFRLVLAKNKKKNNVQKDINFEFDFELFDE